MGMGPGRMKGISELLLGAGVGSLTPHYRTSGFLLTFQKGLPKWKVGAY